MVPQKWLKIVIFPRSLGSNAHFSTRHHTITRGVSGLVFKIDAINGKKWANFVAMQQNSATLIYDLNTMKGTVESSLEKNCQTIQNSFLHIHMYLHVNSPQCHKHLLEQ